PYQPKAEMPSPNIRYDTKALQHIDAEYQEMAARMLGRGRAGGIAIHMIGYLGTVAGTEQYQGVVHGSGIVAQAQHLPMVESVVAFTIQNDQALQRNLLALQDAVAHKLYEELQ